MQWSGQALQWNDVAQQAVATESSLDGASCSNPSWCCIHAQHGHHTKSSCRYSLSVVGGSGGARQSPTYFVEGVHVMDAALGLRGGRARLNARRARGQGSMCGRDAARAQVLESLLHRLYQERDRLPARRHAAPLLSPCQPMLQHSSAPLQCRPTFLWPVKLQTSGTVPDCRRPDPQHITLSRGDTYSLYTYSLYTHLPVYKDNLAQSKGSHELSSEQASSVWEDVRAAD